MSLTESPAVVHGLGAGPSHAANHADAQRPLRLHPLDHIVAGHTVQGKDAMLGADGRLYKPVQVRAHARPCAASARVCFTRAVRLRLTRPGRDLTRRARVHKTRLTMHGPSCPARAQKGEKGQREVKFYERTGLLCPALHPFLPAYYGTLEYDTRQYLALEDIAVQFREPCVLDLKMGVRTYEPTASAEKVASELTKGPHQEQIGFRPCGMRVYGTVSGKYTFRSKRWGQSIEPGTAHSMLAEFMRDDTAERTVRRIERVVPALVLRLRALERTLEQLVGLRFYASSIILVFEGTPEHGGAAVRPSSPPRRAGAPHAGDAALGPRALVDVRMVDFAHWVRAAQPQPARRHLHARALQPADLRAAPCMPAPPLRPPLSVRRCASTSPGQTRATSPGCAM